MHPIQLIISGVPLGLLIWIWFTLKGVKHRILIFLGGIAIVPLVWWIAADLFPRHSKWLDLKYFFNVYGVFLAYLVLFLITATIIKSRSK